jgi:RNA polymerase sigma-70 factor (ECF subfamily)
MDASEQLLEQILVLRAQTRDDGAFEKLVARYRARVAYFVRRSVGNDGSAEDVLQQVWLTAFERLPRLKEPAAFRVWLYRIARNQAVDAVRARRPVEPVELDELSDGDGPAEPEFTAEDAARVHAGLATLRPEHREVLVLRFMEDLDYGQIADVVGCDLGTVKSRLHYAKRALRRELERTS